MELRLRYGVVGYRLALGGAGRVLRRARRAGSSQAGSYSKPVFRWCWWKPASPVTNASALAAPEANCTTNAWYRISPQDSGR